LERKLIVSESRPIQPEQYAIHIKEQIPAHWSNWFGGLTIANLESDGAILSGPVVDQSALHGLLAKVRDLNLTLISVARIEPSQKMTNPGDLE
jgi:hypothetical protein